MTISVTEKLKIIYAWICRQIVVLKMGLRVIRPNSAKSVLLVGSSEVTIEYLLPIADIVKTLGVIKISLLVSRYAREFASGRLADYPIEIELIPMSKALRQVWTVIIFADHNNVQWFHQGIPKVRCPHGLYSGKRLGSADSYVYGRNSVDETGNLYYNVMFIESSHYLKRLIAMNPALESKIAVVGNLMADVLVAQDRQRPKIRQDLAINDSAKVLVILSTWGKNSLIQRFGQLLLEKIESLSTEFKLFCFVHPMNYHAQSNVDPAILEALSDAQRRGLIYRVPPRESFIPYLVAADIVFTDHGSLFLYYALLNRPYLFVPIEPQVLTAGSLLLDFYQAQAKYDPQLDLIDQLYQAENSFLIEKSKFLAERLVEPIGRARELFQAELSKFL